MRLLLLILLTFIFQNDLFSQVIIRGKVTDATNNSPIIGAVVGDKRQEILTTSDVDGKYELLIPTEENGDVIILTVNYLGFKQVKQVVEILPIDIGETLVRNFEMYIDPVALQDVTVTANKVEENLQDVPIAISAINARNLEARTVSNTQQAVEAIPNLVFDAFVPGQPVISLRGLATNITNPGIENAVGLYIDDVFQSRSFNFNSVLMDINRIEVLRGPQGTLFGKNTIGGLLHIISEEPKFANFGSVELSGGNFNLLQTRAKANFELVENKLAVRVAGAYKRRNGWMKENNPEIADENGINFYGGRISLLYQPVAPLKITLRGSYSQDTKTDFTIDYQTPLTPFGEIDLLTVDERETDPTDREIFQSDDTVNFDRNDKSVSAKIEWQLPDSVHTITSVSAYNQNYFLYDRDLDATSNLAASYLRENDVQSFTQEVRISTPREGRKLFYVGGLFFLRDKIINNLALTSSEDALPAWAAILQNPNILNIPNYRERADIFSDMLSTNVAGFMSGSLEFTERVRLNGGLRYTYEEKSINFVQTTDSDFGILNPVVASNIGEVGNPYQRSTSYTAFSGNIGIDLKTTDNMLLYANFSRGFKGAGFNIALTPATDPEEATFLYEPEFVNNYEVGLKYQQGNRFQANIAAFVTDFKNKQEVVAAGTGIYVANAEAVAGQGAEAEFTAIWNKFLRSEMAVGALNIEYFNFEFFDPFTREVENLSRNKAYKAPNATFKFAQEFNFPIGNDLEARLRFDYNFTGKTYNDIYNSERLARQPTGILNGRLSISNKKNRYSISLWARNITEEIYNQHAWSFFFGELVSVNPPRMMGLDLRVNLY
ncbi:MAG: TonB-dependent receptor [Saprospiraceae bacterium]